MKRLFWLGLGLAVGVYVTRRASEAARSLTPAGVGANLADGLRELGAGLGAFGAEVRAGMTERERELTELVERRTGAPLPAMSDAFADARARCGVPRASAPGRGLTAPPDRSEAPSPCRPTSRSLRETGRAPASRSTLGSQPCRPTRSPVASPTTSRRAGHTRVPSASLILDDPNLLFVNAGMVQFKPYFLGEVPPPYPRATSIQKCVRTGDIDEVGKTTRHNTFFQMAGNFSFGDYFKAGAIEHAWNLVTGRQDAGGYGFDPDRIWVTVYDDDDEAFELWRQIAGLPAERIQRRGGEDNYWDMGVPGPGRALLGDLLRPRPRARSRGRPGRRRGPLPGDLEPRLHAGRARRAVPEERAPADRQPAEEEHRHRHGRRAGRLRCCRAWRTSTRPTWCAR